jgi:hypothetical protein
MRWSKNSNGKPTLGAINVDEMVHLYSREYSQPVRTLVQNIQTQMAVYHNVFEELKSGPVSEGKGQGIEGALHGLRLIAQSNEWPNPDGQ